MYQVLENGIPADCFNYPTVHKSWNKSIFSSFEEANQYAYYWALPVSKEQAAKIADENPLSLNEERDLSYCEFPVIMKIVEIP